MNSYVILNLQHGREYLIIWLHLKKRYDAENTIDRACQQRGELELFQVSWIEDILKAEKAGRSCKQHT